MVKYASEVSLSNFQLKLPNQLFKSNKSFFGHIRNLISNIWCEENYNFERPQIFVSKTLKLIENKIVKMMER